MTQRAEEPRFALEGLTRFVTGRGHLLDRNGVAEPQIDRLVDRAHAAPADGTQHVITAVQQRG